MKDRNQGKTFGQVEKDQLGGVVETPKKRTFLGQKPGNGVKLTPFQKKEFRAYTRGHSTFYHSPVMVGGKPLRRNDGSIVLHEHKVRVAYL